MPDNTPPRATKQGPPREQLKATHSSVQRQGDLDPSKWDEQEAVTGRPNDVADDNSTFASRKKGQDAKQVSTKQAENKAVTGSEKKDS